jgi:hypothetical protein
MTRLTASNDGFHLEGSQPFETCACLSAGVLSRCFDDESHDEDCNGDGATEVGNVRVKSFHAASVGRMSLLFFLWPMAKA